MCVYVYIYIYIYTHTYIYIYIERERYICLYYYSILHYTIYNIHCIVYSIVDYMIVIIMCPAIAQPSPASW